MLLHARYGFMPQLRHISHEPPLPQSATRIPLSLPYHHPLTEHHLLYLYPPLFLFSLIFSLYTMSKGLSDKAKGKQRAVEPVEEPPSRELMVRFTEGVPDLTIRVAKKDFVRDVKNNVRINLL